MSTEINKLDAQTMLNIRYKIFHFMLRIGADGYIPRYKASAFRGGIGDVLVEEYDDETVQNMMYSKLEIPIPFVTENDSFGYIVDSDDARTHLTEGGMIYFDLTLFGKSIAYFDKYLHAVQLLGQRGIGREHIPFQVETVTDENDQLLWKRGQEKLPELSASMLWDIVHQRKRELLRSGWNGCVQVTSPLALKYKKEFLKQWNIDAFISAIRRRIYIMNCFEGNEIDFYYGNIETGLRICEQESREISVPRYSTRKNTKMNLWGLTGSFRIDLDDLSEEQLEELVELLAAGEILQIGKHTSFGFGKYVLRGE